MSSRAFITGVSGPELSAAERDFIRGERPWGFILFKRNIENPSQVSSLVRELLDSIDNRDAPVLIDQEGGRVARLGPPHWPRYPAAAAIGRLGGERAREAASLSARLIADDLQALGITVDCLPVLDLPASGANPVIGDRAYGSDPQLVATLGRAACEGLLAGGVLPVIKHIPGHGRAAVDSHHALPTVTVDRATLEASDLVPFRALAHMPWAMTAHIVYRAFDPELPATLSRRVIGEIIRAGIGFDGVLISDDLSMRALGGGLGERTRRALEAGCDVALHCNAEMREMALVAAASAPLSAAARRRVERGEAQRRPPTAFDRPAALARLGALLSSEVA